jgi:Fe2+ transport system protein FeoA
MTEENIISLYKTCKGRRFWIVSMPEGKSKNQLVRLGISKGVSIKCLERLPGGTVVIEKNRREIAIGIALAKSIYVTAVPSKTTEKKV